MFSAEMSVNVTTEPPPGNSTTPFTVGSLVKQNMSVVAGVSTTLVVLLIIVCIAYKKIMKIREAGTIAKKRHHTVDEQDLQDPDEMIKEDPETQSLLCRLAYSYDSETLKVSQIQCHNLEHSGVLTLNTRVKVKIEPKSLKKKELKTEIFKNSSDPRFNASMSFPLSRKEIKKAVIVWEVYSCDPYIERDKLLGDVREDILDKGKFRFPREVRRDIVDRSKEKQGNGDICIILRNSPLMNELKVTVLEAKNLTLKAKKNYPPVYATVTLYCRNERPVSEKTQMRYNTDCPYFMDSFNFTLQTGKIHNALLEIKVFKKPFIGVARCIGWTKIGNMSETVSGKAHWSEMVMNPKKSIAYWHYLW